MSETPATTKASSVYSDLVEADKRSILAKVLSAGFPVNKKKSEITPTVKTDINDSDQTDADRQSILAKALSTDLFKVSRLVVKSKNAEENEKAIESDIEEEIKSIFHEDEVDDSEEIFQRTLKAAEEAFKREMAIKAKNPLLYEMMTQQTKAPSQPRKRKCNKMAEDTRNVIQLFRKSLAEAKTPVRPALTDYTSTVNSKRGSKTKSSNDYITPIGNRNQVKIYPAWKTTANYTPIFSRTTNPRWTKNNEIMSTADTKSSNLYTPNHIYNWIEDKANTDFTGPSPERTTPKSHKSNDATCQSMTSLTKSPTLLGTTLIGSPITSNNFMRKKRITSSTPIRESPIMGSTMRKNPVISSTSTRKSTLTSSTSIHKSSIISRNSWKSPVISSTSMPKSPIMLSPPMPRNSIISNTSMWKSPITFSPVQRNPITSSTSVQSPILLSPLERKSPITFSSPPTRNTVVRFRPSPPEYITYSGDYNNSSVSSTTFLFEENNEFNEISSEPDEFNDEYSKPDEFYPKDYESCSHYFQEYSKKYENVPEDQQQSSNQYATDHCYVDANNDFNEANKNNFYSSGGKQPFSIDEFMRNLNRNVMMRHRNSAKNMEVKYSMRVKLF